MYTRALLVGINKYKTADGNFRNLRGCVNDLAQMLETMRLMQVCPDDQIRQVVDEAATTRAMLGHLDWWIENVRPGDQVFFFYSGHGVRVPDTDAEAEEEDRMDEAFVTHDFSKTEPLLDDIFHHYLSQVPDGARATVVLDCCHSGGLDKGVGGTDGPEQARGADPISRAEYTPSELTDLAKHKQSYAVQSAAENILIVAACQPWQQAWEREFDGHRHGLLTYSLCQQLQSGGQQVTARQAIDHCARFIEEAGYYQIPRLIGKEEFFDAPLIA